MRFYGNIAQGYPTECGEGQEGTCVEFKDEKSAKTRMAEVKEWHSRQGCRVQPRPGSKKENTGGTWVAQ